MYGVAYAQVGAVVIHYISDIEAYLPNDGSGQRPEEAKPSDFVGVAVHLVCVDWARIGMQMPWRGCAKRVLLRKPWSFVDVSVITLNPRDQQMLQHGISSGTKAEPLSHAGDVRQCWDSYALVDFVICPLCERHQMRIINFPRRYEPSRSLTAHGGARRS